MQEPCVSIITPLFNKEKYILSTINSVISQSYNNWEYIIVDDHSTDASYKIASDNSITDNRILLVKRTGSSKGTQVCRNEGMDKSRGEYLVFLDADDCLAHDCIKSRVNYLQNNPELDFAVFLQRVFHNNPEDSKYLINTWDSSSSDITRFLQFTHNIDVPWLNTSPIWKKASLLNNNIYWDESVLVYQDVAFHLSALLSGMQYHKVKKVDCYWRRGLEDNLGKSIRSTESLLSTYDMLINILETIGSEGLLTSERRRLIKQSYYYIIVNLIYYNRYHDKITSKEVLVKHGIVDDKPCSLAMVEYIMKRFSPYPRVNKFVKNLALFLLLEKYKWLYGKRTYKFARVALENL